MGTKLKISLLVTLSMVLSACYNSRKFKDSGYYVSKNEFTKSYKSAFICGCINNLTNNSLKEFMTKVNDNGLFSDVELISYQIVKEADSVGRLYSKNILPVMYEDAGNSKPIISGCIKLALGKDVEQISVLRYKKVVQSFKKEN